MQNLCKMYVNIMQKNCKNYAKTTQKIMQKGYSHALHTYTGGPRIVLFLRTQGTVLLTKPYYSGTDLVLK